MGALILGIGLLIGLIVFLKWYSTASPEALWKVLRWGGVTIAIVLGLFLLLRGGLQFLWIAAAFLLPWFLRLRGMRNWARAARPKAGGQSSTVRTRFVAMELDHDTGEMDGEILEGPYSGQRLSSLDLDSLIDLLHLTNREDAQSARVLQSYLDRMHGDLWRERAGSAADGDEETHTAPGSGQMSREEAFEVLGLAPEASDADIKAAHRRLIREYHPDHGGSDYLASKINEAKDLLLKG